MKEVTLIMTLFVILLTLFGVSRGQAPLTPPYLNLAAVSTTTISATATCGEGVPDRELYCHLTGAIGHEPTDDHHLIQGQFCDYCDPKNPAKAHPASQAIDGTERWWQSPPLSRGLQYNEVTVTINLGQEFHVAYVFLKMGNSPRPGVWALERTQDHGKTWKPWQYFADTLSDCVSFFGRDNYKTQITADDTVICTTEYSKIVPLKGGEVVVSLVNNRPSANNFSYSKSLQEWTKATGIRLRLLRTKNTLGHLMAVARQDPSVTRRYYYSLKDVSIGGRCVCNGHADVCDKTDPYDPARLVCRCQHNTCGAQCETCCPGFVQKQWKPVTLESLNECEPCQCYGHADECTYDKKVDDEKRSIDIHGRYEGGGVCQNCRHNTEGVNCEKCRPGFFRATGTPLDSPNVCRRCRCDSKFSTGECETGTGRCTCKAQYAGSSCSQCNNGYYGFPDCIPCDCNFNGTVEGVCEVGGGQCPCKFNYDGNNCDRCAEGFYNFPLCTPCECGRPGSASDVCDGVTGACTCLENYSGRDCNQCADGYFNYPICSLCTCDTDGTTPTVCDKDTGECQCEKSYTGSRCEACAVGYYKYPECKACECDEHGAEGEDCDAFGQCQCRSNFGGSTCDRCASGFYRFPNCLPCHCDSYGSYDVTCDQETGQCNCRPTFQGAQCSKCLPNYYNYPICEECNCNPAGAKEVPGHPLGGCGEVTRGQLCECKERVTGRECELCKPGYWNLDIRNPNACEQCECSDDGTISSSNICDGVSGQCVCKTYVNGLSCNRCVDGTYNLLRHNVFGCEDCKCNPGGSVDQNCNKQTGQCTCRPRATGLKCDKVLGNHYAPNLFQHQYEMEDGHTPSGGAVRYNFDQQTFPGFSWRGYAILSRIQEEIVVDVKITKPSLYRLVFYYVNLNSNNVLADITVTPEASSDVQQTSTVVFAPTSKPQFVTVSGAGLPATAFVLNPGQWTISLKAPENLLVDYLVLLPQAYYEPAILSEEVKQPCTCPATDDVCRHYVYADMSRFPSARGEEAYTGDDSSEKSQMFENIDLMRELETSSMAWLDDYQNSLSVSISVPSEGKYVFVVQFHSNVSDKGQKLAAEISSTTGTENGEAILPNCPYCSLCRKLITNENGDPIIAEVNDNHVVVKLTGDDSIRVAIDAVIAVPVDDWTLDYLRPKLKCLRRDKQCTESEFVTPTGSIRVEVESKPNEDRVETDVPPSITDTSVKVIKVDSTTQALNVKATVQNAGDYVFVVHYYQPYHTSVEVTADVSADYVFPGKFSAEFCPSAYGCRVPISFKDNGNGISREVIDDFVISFESNSSRPVWLDYVLVIPASQYKPSILNIQGIDFSVDFIKKCGYNNFHVDKAGSAQCRKAAYVLATEYNNGGLECGCNPEGSLRFQCDEFGGQCPCKANIIGRTCSQCKTGYYGFPNCKQCNCPSGLCEPTTGKCVCPPLVTGPNCNICLPQTFGFDPLIGCEECNCDPEGVVGNNLDCEINSGQCNCKPNIGGRRCNQCVAGYYSFPYCMQCSCEKSGSTPEVCDQRSAECLCKENVEGAQCTDCVASTFYLEDRNPKGCTKCFCFGTTTVCDSSDLYRKQVREMMSWGITNLKTYRIEQSEAFKIEVNVDESEYIYPEEALYWVAPETYLRNKVTSYGGKLIYSVDFQLPSSGQSHGIVKPDVRIEGHNMTIVHISPEQPSVGDTLTVELDILETKFVHELSGAPVSREQFMMVLADIKSLQIRASYYSRVSYVSLHDVHMDIATDDGTGEVARNVEQCQCPRNYIGTSCETCAPGFYRQRTGPFLGNCVPCQCQGRADDCDRDTGTCKNCRDNYDGPQCLTCKQGFYEDSNTGTCKICACPLALPSNNFAATCDVGPRGVVIRCHCLPGYSGPRCESCDRGYWGNPNVLDGGCKPCDCSGNIDIDDPKSCDIETGECVKCTHDTAGERCERCKDWFYGDAIDLKNCKQCPCNTLGAAQCDHLRGTCVCKPNVIGPNCDKCAPGTYGLESGNGCSPCNCAQASYGQDCDAKTGQCRCKPYVTGRRCDSCEQNYWNYQTAGCTRCQCDFESAVTCDAHTGQCTCLPGVTGAKCDQCLDRWVLVKDKGCFECDNCVHLLLDDVEVLDTNITLIRKELNSISIGAWALVRLQRINETVYVLRPKVDALVRDPADTAQLDSIKIELKRLIELSETTRHKADKAVREAEIVEHDADDLLVESRTLTTIIDIAINISQSAVTYVKDILQDIRDSIHDTNIDSLIRQAEEILVEIRRRDFTLIKNSASTELDAALDVLEKAKNLLNKAMEQVNKTLTVKARIESLQDKLRDLMNNSRSALDFSQLAATLNERNLRIKITITETIVRIREGAADARTMIDSAKELLVKAKQYLEDARKAYMEADKELSKLDVAKEELRKFTEDLARENEELRPLVDNATEHALKLRRQAEMLESLISSTKESAEGALNASRAYQAIIDAIDKAWNASKEAIDAANKAEQLSNGLAEQARRSKERSLELKDLAESTKETVTTRLQQRVSEAKRTTEIVATLNRRTREEITVINNGLGVLPSGGYSEQARQASQKAMDAKTKADEARRKIAVILEKLPGDLQRAKDIPRIISEVNHNIQGAQVQVEKALELVPEATTLINRLKIRADVINEIGINLGLNVSALREKITIARGEASRITIGVRCQKNTAIQVRSPQNLLQAESYTKLSLYFRTVKPDGVLAFIGTDRSSYFGKPDFFAVEIINSNVVFKFDLGGGPAEIVVNRNVSDGEWHEVIAERTGNSGTVRVRSDIEPTLVEATGTAPGTHSVFDLRADATKFFIGGIPSTATGLQDKIKNLHFEGCIDDVKFGGLPVGLWDFAHGEHNNLGCAERKVLLEPPVDSFYFNGKGFVTLPQENFLRQGKDTRLTIKFRTYAENGLLVLMYKDRDFLSIELHDGKVLFQFNLGSGPGRAETKEKYNDGKVYTIQANRFKQQGLLRIEESSETVSLRSSGSQQDLEILPQIYIGGHQGKHGFGDITQQGFEGCILEVYLGSTRRSLDDNIMASGILPGCVQEARVVHFNPAVEKSYVAMERVSIDNKFSMTFKMKTTEKEGLLFYTADDTQENSMSISIVNGRIFVLINNGGIRTILESNATNYNDGRWHYISVNKIDKDVQLDIDDMFIEKKQIAGNLRKLTTTTPLYFGGAPANIPSGQLVTRENVGTSVHFIGCLGDVTVNGNFLAFDKVGDRDRPGCLFTTCPIADPVVPTTPAPVQPIIPTPSVPAELQRCGLPMKPEEEDPNKVGIRFGLQPQSRAEYDRVYGVTSSKFNFTLDVKTHAANGLIFFATETTHKDFVMVTLQGGKIVYTFSCGEEPAIISTTALYNDDQWHSIEFSRLDRNGRLVVDGRVFTGTAPGTRVSLDLDPPFYIGGVSNDAVELALDIVQNQKQSLVGCVRNFKSEGQALGQPTEVIATEPCSSAESGAFFYSDGGYLKLSDNFRVGFDLDIKLDFRPRVMSGVLLSVHSQSNGEYLVLQLVNGELWFSVENGNGEMVTKFEPPIRNSLCDGRWHSIKALKAKNVITLTVDNIAASQPGLGTLERSTDTNDALYIGGVPSIHQGIKTQTQFVGCLRNLVFNTTLQNFATGLPVGHVNQRSCPVN